MSVQTLTVTAIPAFPTGLLPAGGMVPQGKPIPQDLIVTSVRRVNSTLPFLLTAAMAIGLIIADWSLHLPWEWRLLRTRSRWKLSHLFYFCSRIGGLAVAVTSVLHQFLGNVGTGPESLGRERYNYADFSCNSVKKANNFFSAMSIAGSTGILLLRCLALWRFNRAIMVPLCLVWLTTPVLIFMNVFNLASRSQGNGLSACQNLPPKFKAHPVLSYMPWFILPCFDSAILILSLVGLHRATSQRAASKLERMFRFDNLLYYVVTLVMVLPIPIWYLAQGRDGRMWPYVSLYISLSSVLSCRIFINLWKAIGRELALTDTRNGRTSGSAGGSGLSGGGGGGGGAYSTQRRTHGATSLGVPTVELRTQRSPRSAMTTDGDLDNPDEDEDEGFDSHEGSSCPDNKDLSDTDEKVQHRVVPQWTDVDPDLAFSLRGAQMLDEEKGGAGLQSSP